jgi:hypothetical protein
MHLRAHHFFKGNGRLLTLGLMGGEGFGPPTFWQVANRSEQGPGSQGAFLEARSTTGRGDIVNRSE